MNVDAGHPAPYLPKPIANLKLINQKRTLELYVPPYSYPTAIPEGGAVRQALAWDLITHVDAEISIIAGRLSLPVFIYFISRIFTLSGVVTAVIFSTGSQVSCEAASRANMILFLLGHLTTLLLFFLRVRAVFYKRPWTQSFFFFLWLATAATCFLLLFYVKGNEVELHTVSDTINNIIKNNGDDTNTDSSSSKFITFLSSSRICVQSGYKPICAVCLLTTFLNDTAVFLAVSLQLMSNFPDEDTMSHFDRLKCLVWKRKVSLPTIARTLLRGGQQYYLVSLVATVGMIIMTFLPSVHPVMKSNIAAPYATLVNIMACKVFRDVKLGRHNSNGIVTSTGVKFVEYDSRESSTSLPTMVPAPGRFHSSSHAHSSMTSTISIMVETLITTDAEPIELENPAKAYISSSYLPCNCGNTS